MKKVVNNCAEWWSALLKGEKEIDLEKINRERDLNGLPADAGEKLAELYKKEKKTKSKAVTTKKAAAKTSKKKLTKQKQENVFNVSGLTQDDFQKNPETYNGAAREKYDWSQEFGEVNAKFHMPSHIQKNDQVRVEITATHLLIEIEDEDNTKPMIKFIDADFKHEINAHDAATTWYMEDSNVEGIKDIGVSFLLLCF